MSLTSLILVYDLKHISWSIIYNQTSHCNDDNKDFIMTWIYVLL